MHRESRAALRNAEAMQTLSEELRRVAISDEESGVRVLSHIDTVKMEIGAAADAAEVSVFTSHPKVRFADTLTNAWATGRVLVERGLTFKTIYLDNARTRQPEQEYVAKMTAIGGEIRTALPPFERMIIFDERLAFLTDHEGDQETKPAVMVTHPSLVRFIVNVFHQQWDRAEPWDVETVSGVTTLRTRGILRRLSAGMPVKAIAQALKISPATLYTDMKALREHLGVETDWQVAMWWATSEEARKERERDR
ncbi:LuxR C-terminal-related transcriptional regulator [Streptomyces sp. BI20]|uniref:LuxR C-terminal-related transcriptional regulator n=1 Tax=Streptomyces sp. BI20 TaxID=3403460 RepID=UPI003C73C0F3